MTLTNAGGGALPLTGNGDHMFVDGDKGGGTAAVPFGVSIKTDSDMTIDGKATFTNDVSFTSESLATSGIPKTGLLVNADSLLTLNNASLVATGHPLTLDAHSNVNFSDTTGLGGKTVTGTIITSQDTAKIDIHGGLLQASDIKITSAIDGSLTAGVDDASVTIKLLAIGGYARPEVTIDGGSQVTAANTLKVTASSDITTTATAKPDAANPNSDSKVDAAVVVTAFENSSTVAVTGGSTLAATGGAATLLASDKLKATSIADASIGSAAGATVAWSTITGDTTAYVDNATVKGASVSVEADTSRDVKNEAKSSSGGSKDSGGKNTSQDALGKNNASTSDGKITVAGAIAVGTDTGTTSAYLKNATIDAGATGTASVVAASLDKIDLNADGEFTSKGTNGVGVGVAIGAAVRSDLAYVTGANDVTTGSLDVKVAELNGKRAAFSAIATSGVGDSTNVGFAGSLGINVTVFDHQAYLDTGATLTMHGATSNVTFEAKDDVANTAKALSADGGGFADKVGIGASVAFNYSEDTTDAYIASTAGLTGAHDVTLSADSSHEMETEAKGGGKGGTAITPIVAISIADDEAYATLGNYNTSTDQVNNTGSALSLTGAFKATSSLADSGQHLGRGRHEIRQDRRGHFARPDRRERQFGGHDRARHPRHQRCDQLPLDGHFQQPVHRQGERVGRRAGRRLQHAEGRRQEGRAEDVWRQGRGRSCRRRQKRHHDEGQRRRQGSGRLDVRRIGQRCRRVRDQHRAGLVEGLSRRRSSDSHHGPADAEIRGQCRWFRQRRRQRGAG